MGEPGPRELLSPITASTKFGVDGQRLGIVGSSAGGLIALMIAMRGQDGDGAADDLVEHASSRVQAVGCFFPPTDLMNFGEASEKVVDFLRQRGIVDSGFQFYDVDDRTGARALVTEREDVLRMLREMSPLTHVTADDPSTMLVHGDEDRAIPLRQSRRLIDHLNDAKVAARLVVREGMRHAWVGMGFR